ncbi:MAG: hypothetical protein KDA16_06095 [Phycisphaerales bacterium]|nr:hypothetical protein [Phycisphaerales bacterium]
MKLHWIVSALAITAASHAMAQDDAPAPEGPAERERIFPSFDVWFPEEVFAEPVSGRLIIYMISDDAPIGRGMSPVRGPFMDSAQPMFGVDVKDLKPGEHLIVNDANSLGCPVTLNDLQEGGYRVQMLLDVQRNASDWREETGHLMSGVHRVYFNGPDGIKDNPAVPDFEFPIDFRLGRVWQPSPESTVGLFEYMHVKSEILSEFWGHDFELSVAVIPPVGLDNGKKYPAIYQVPGFGGTHKDGYRFARMRSQNPGFNIVLNRSAYRIVINPEGPNGHNLCADSENNGPVARAIIEELIPALEAKYPLIAKPEARVLEGHSSGAWSSIWLAMNYPDTFGGAWASAPDPVDFRAFQIGNIYEDDNLYVRDDEVVPAFRRNGEPIYSVALENGYEEVMGPDNSSGQQWDSWQGVFGPKGENGHPAALYNAGTGVIDHDIADQYRKYDIAYQLREAPEKFGPIFKNNIRVRVGDMDSYYLNNAVELLKASLEDAGYLGAAQEWGGYVEIEPRLDHSTINDFDWHARMGEEMVAHFKKFEVMPTRADGDGADPDAGETDPE